MARPQQSVCKGVLVFEQSGGKAGPYASSCFGIGSTLDSAPLDLEGHHEATRSVHMQPAQGVTHYMHSLTCVGVGTYQHQPSTPQGEIPPPACIGLEFLRYGQAVAKHRQPATSSSPLHTLPDTADELPGLPVPQYHQQQHQQHQQQHMSVSPEQQAAADEEQQPRTLFDRLQAVHREASERLEGQDPMWFAKAWVHRAELNVASMKKMARQLVDAARSDLGLGPQESDEERSP